MIFLDSDIITYYFQANKRIKERLDSAILDDELICTTVINAYEVLKGLRWKDPKNMQSQVVYFLNNIIIQYIDNEVVNLAANIYADLRKKGISIGDSDILIAAIVIANKGTLVTNNTKHFENIEQLKVVNWV